jgi:hypothetical protein
MQGVKRNVIKVHADHRDNRKGDVTMTSTRTGTLLAVAVSLALLLAVGSAIASPPDEGLSGTGEVRLAGAVQNRISYQGRVTDASGNPLEGTYHMCFAIWDDETYGSQLSSTCQSVGVTDGLFNVELVVSAGIFNGQALWLSVQVGDQWLSPRQALLPVPYALSLRPGAVISSSTSSAVLHVENTHSSGRGLRGYATAPSGTTYGVVGASKSTDGFGGYFYNTEAGGTGVYARGGEWGADLVLGGTASNSDGRIHSDPAYDSSDIRLVSNDGVTIDLDEDNNPGSSSFSIRNADNDDVFSVDEAGNVAYGGSNRAAFPRPAYDSGWVEVVDEGCLTLFHGLGGDADNYVVDMQASMWSRMGVTNAHIGGAYIRSLEPGEYTYSSGFFYTRLTNTDIDICRLQDGAWSPLRVRIWVYE